MAGNRKTQAQKCASKIDKTIARYAKIFMRQHIDETGSMPTNEEKLNIYTQACKYAMTELSSDERVVLFDFYFLKGIPYFVAQAEQVVAEEIGRHHAYSQCPKKYDTNTMSLKMGKNYYNKTTTSIKDKVGKKIRSDVGAQLELLTEMLTKDQKRKLMDKLSTRHFTKELDRERHMASFDQYGSEIYENYIKYESFDDLVRSCVRDVTINEFKLLLESGRKYARAEQVAE